MMKSLKFCMVTTFYPPYNFGGDGIFVYRLANALARDGHQVHVIHDLDSYTQLTKEQTQLSFSNHENITLYKLSCQRFKTLDLLCSHQLGRPIRKQKTLQQIFDQNNFDVIHFHNISLMGGPGILRFGEGLKLCTLHDHWFVCPMHVLWRFNREVCQKRTCLRCTLAGGRPPQFWRYNNTIADVVDYVDCFIAPSNFTRKSHTENGFPAPIRYLPHFISSADESPLNIPNQDSTDNSPYFLFVGRLEKIKGVQILLEVFQQYNSANLLIAGSGTYEKELRHLANGLSHVHFLGLVPSQQLKILYQRAVAVIVPSICYETFGLVPIEAFSVKTPAIVHNLGSLPEVIQDGGGVSYDTQEELLSAMQNLQNDFQHREDLSIKAYENFQKNYTEKIHLNKYYDLIKELKLNYSK